MQFHPSEQPTKTPTPQSSVLPQASPNRDKHRREGLRSVFATLGVLLLAPILALLITAFVFQSYEVDGPSMERTLQTGDRLIVWKVGRTWSRITKHTYIPPRGTVVVFVKRGLYDFNSDREKQLIKRIIGVPGDRVVVKDGSITVYNAANPTGFNPDENPAHGQDATGEITGEVDITVGPDEIFVVGDHRDNSLDSRSFGTVPAKDIVGTMSARLLPFSEAEKF